MSLFDDSPEIRNTWSYGSGEEHERRLKQLKAEFLSLEREPRARWCSRDVEGVKLTGSSIVRAAKWY